MGLYDRDYYRERMPSGVGAIHVWSVTTWLIVINIAIFVLDGFFRRAAMAAAASAGEYYQPDSLLMRWGAFTIQDAILRGQVWRLITCQFLHAGIWHILVNMIGLWMFGPVVELTLGGRRFALFYFLCGIAGPVMFMILGGLGILMPAAPGQLFPAPDVQMVGASAGIFGVLMGAAYLSPDRLIYVYFFELPLKYFAWILMGIAAYTVLTGGGNAGGQAAHLGGGILGWIWIRQHGALDITPKRRVRGRLVKDWSRDMNR